MLVTFFALLITELASDHGEFAHHVTIQSLMNWQCAPAMQWLPAVMFKTACLMPIDVSSVNRIANPTGQIPLPKRLTEFEFSPGMFHGATPLPKIMNELVNTIVNL
ncbi:hypothetical protein ACTXT7_011379 [Hymenolepis weldensis]